MTFLFESYLPAGVVDNGLGGGGDWAAIKRMKPVDIE